MTTWPATHRLEYQGPRPHASGDAAGMRIPARSPNWSDLNRCTPAVGQRSGAEADLLSTVRPKAIKRPRSGQLALLI
jgi:hypothetical protein